MEIWCNHGFSGSLFSIYCVFRVMSAHSCFLLLSLGSIPESFFVVPKRILVLGASTNHPRALSPVVLVSAPSSSSPASRSPLLGRLPSFRPADLQRPGIVSLFHFPSQYPLSRQLIVCSDARNLESIVFKTLGAFELLEL